MCRLQINLPVLIRPPGTVVPEGLMFYFFVISPQDLPASLADRRETLPHVQYMRQLYYARPIIPGLSPFNILPSVKFWSILQLPTLLANISGKRQDIQNRKDIGI